MFRCTPDIVNHNIDIWQWLNKSLKLCNMRKGGNMSIRLNKFLAHIIYHTKGDRHQSKYVRFQHIWKIKECMVCGIIDFCKQWFTTSKWLPVLFCFSRVGSGWFEDIFGVMDMGNCLQTALSTHPDFNSSLKQTSVPVLINVVYAIWTLTFVFFFCYWSGR